MEISEVYSAVSEIFLITRGREAQNQLDNSPVDRRAAKLIADIIDVVTRRSLCDAKPLGNLGGGQSLRHEYGNILLTGS
jgi:hypothetical protein